MPDALKDAVFLAECAEWLDKNGMADKLMMGIANGQLAEGIPFVEEKYDGEWNENLVKKNQLIQQKHRDSHERHPSAP